MEYFIGKIESSLKIRIIDYNILATQNKGLNPSQYLEHILKN